MELTTQKDVLTYIKDAITLETELETHRTLLAKANEISQSRKPVKPQKTIYNKPCIPVTYDKSKLFTAIATAGIGIPFTILGHSLSSTKNNGFIGMMILLMGVGCIIGALCLLYSYYNDRTTEKQQKAQYDELLQDWEKKQDAANKQYNLAVEEESRQLRLWQAERNLIQSRIQKEQGATTRVLDKLYALDLIYPKYRNLPALTSICEYLETGRCTELTGPHGAYNMYEDEVRKDTVISQLNTVIENLEQIRKNQYMLYQQVKAIQQNTAKITAELRQIRGYAAASTQLLALNTYYAALNERNNRITMYYHL